jgi:hypothetical protein
MNPERVCKRCNGSGVDPVPDEDVEGQPLGQPCMECDGSRLPLLNDVMDSMFGPRP